MLNVRFERKKASGSFLKKRTKKLLRLVPRTGDPRCAARWGRRKSFCFFFQKEALALLFQLQPKRIGS